MSPSEWDLGTKLYVSMKHADTSLSLLHLLFIQANTANYCIWTWCCSLQCFYSGSVFLTIKHLKLGGRLDYKHHSGFIYYYSTNNRGCVAVCKL